jgi:glycosyltransferase involved in cell wall biosynthesis
VYSVVIPVYKNADFVPLLITEFTSIATAIQERFAMDTEFVFVVDGSPDDSYSLLSAALESAPFRSQLILHARNFGSFAAIRTGLRAALGDYVGVIAADLQEPPELLIRFLEPLVTNTQDVVVGVREGREDPALSRASSELFWALYRRLIMKEIPEGGVDMFACSRRFETNSSSWRRRTRP